MADIFDNHAHTRPDVTPTIYAYNEPGSAHAEYIKVGYTNRSAQERIDEQFPTLRPGDQKPYEILLIESAVRADGTTFTDKDVHKALERMSHPRLPGPNGRKTEYFSCNVEDVKAAILAVRERTLNEENRTQTFKPREEQQWAIERTKEYFEREIGRGRTPKFLWNAKMRFGKTFASYELALAMGMTKILVITFKPAVEDAWEEDLLSHVDFAGWQFYSKNYAEKLGKTSKELYESLDLSRPIVCFGSFQDFLGNDNGRIKAKNEWVHTTNWDMVIFDEYHFGAWRDTAKKLFEFDEDSYDTLDLEEYKEKEAGNAYNESFLPITSNCYLYLSGTPFRSLYNGEFIEEQIFSWTYSDEQAMKEKHADEGDSSPYAALPKMVMMTYRMPEEIQRIAINTDNNEFDLNAFFAATYDASKGEKEEDAQFIHKDYVQKWLDMMRGAYMPTTVDEYKQGGNNKPVMPFSDVRMLNILTHTFWFLPGVASCYAMYNLLSERQNTFYHTYEVIVCAGTSAGVGLKALGPVRTAMDMSNGAPVGALKTKTITLSCGKLTTGVTVKPWTGIFMLRNLSSPETYFQAAFRVQSPWTVKDENLNDLIIKRECYIFDFALNRALSQIADYSNGLSVEASNPEKRVADFIHFLPVLAYDGSRMTEIDAKAILEITMSGTSATMLAKRWESALLVNVDNDTLKRILDNPDALAAIMNIEGFRSLNSDTIQTIINKSEHVKKTKKEKGNDLTEREKKQLTEEEKEYKTKRKEIQDKLIKFATRIPIFMYLSDYREYSLKDVITQFEPRLFKKVTGLTVKEFELLVSIGVFNDSVMNEAVYKFKLYEDASLEYTGINKHSEDENVGLFSTIISKYEFDALVQEQIGSMTPKDLGDRTEVKATPEKAEEKPKPKKFTPKPKADPAEIGLVAEENGSAYKAQKPVEEETVTFNVGDRIDHKKFGTGTVTGFKGEKKIEIAFDEGGTKIFGLDVIAKFCQKI